MKIRIALIFLAFSCSTLTLLQADSGADVEMSAACKKAASRGRYAALGLSEEEKKNLRDECCNNNEFFEHANAMYALGCRRY